MTRARFSQQEDDVLRGGRAAGRSYAAIAAEMPGRDAATCRGRAQKLGLVMKRGETVAGSALSEEAGPALSPDSCGEVRSSPHPRPNHPSSVSIGVVGPGERAGDGVPQKGEGRNRPAGESPPDNTHPSLFHNSQRLCAAGAAAEDCELSREEILTLPGKNVAGAAGRAMSEARWSVALALSEINDRDALDIHMALGWSASRSNARGSLKRLLGSGWMADGVAAIVTRLRKACPYHDQRLSDGPPCDPGLLEHLTGKAGADAALGKPPNWWSPEELAVLEAACAKGPTLRELGRILPGRGVDACRLEATRRGWYIPRPRAVSEFNGVAPRRKVIADDDPDVKLGAALSAGYHRMKSVPSLSPAQTTHEHTGSGGMGGGEGRCRTRGKPCKWPIGDPLEPDFRFCGHKTPPGRSYCEAHRDISIDRVLAPLHSEAGIPGFRLQNRGAGR